MLLAVRRVSTAFAGVVYKTPALLPGYKGESLMESELRVKIQDIQQMLDEARNEAEDADLQIVVSWQDKDGNMQSVKLGPDDLVYVTAK